MRVLNLVDRCFEGSPCSTAGQTLPSDCMWDRDRSTKDAVTVYSNIDAFVTKVEDSRTSYGWLYESIEVMPFMFIAAPSILPKFNKIFTYYLPLINTWPDKFKYIPAMGSWLHDFKPRPFKQKSNMLSMICSPKKNTFSQVMRHDIAEQLHKEGVCHVYGPEFNNLIKKEDALDDYKFSVVMENGVQPGYFTEKLIDCFMSKTIPIYYGDPCLHVMASKYGIKLSGIIPFNSWVKDPKILDSYLNDPKIEDIIDQNYNAAVRVLSATPEIQLFNTLC